MIILSILKYAVLIYFAIVLLTMITTVVAAIVYKAKFNIKWLRWVVYSPLVFFMGLSAFVLVPIGMIWAGKSERVDDTYPLPDGVTWDTIESYRLPEGLRWLETFDDRNGVLPGGLYEPSIAETYFKKGWKAASIKWLMRNRAYRLAKLVSVRPNQNVLAYGKEMFEPGIRLLVLDGPSPAFEVQIASPVLFKNKLIWVRAGWKLECFVGGEQWSEETACGLLQDFSPRIQDRDGS